jgi:anti-sigma-K factor RskA
MPALDIPSCDEVEPLLAAFALGDHDAEARALIEAHLDACATCRHTLAAYQMVAHLLPLGAPDAAPSPELRARVTAAVAAAARREDAAPPRGAPPQSWWRRARRWLPRAGWALATVALAALLVWNLALQRDLADARTAQQRDAVALAALLHDPQVQQLLLRGDAIAPAARGTLVLALSRNEASLAVSGLPALPAGHVYQLWLVRQGQRISGGTFTVDAEGCGNLVVQTPAPLSSYDTVGVTVEPAGGSPGPTTPRVIGGKVL